MNVAQLVYQDKAGKLVCVKNPTDADMGRFWDDFAAKHGAAIEREFIRNLRESGSRLFDMIA